MDVITVSTEFRRAVEDSPKRQRELAEIGGLPASRFNAIIHGDRLGLVTQQRILAIGQALGLTADACFTVRRDVVRDNLRARG